jgi:hypothetical protein
VYIENGMRQPEQLMRLRVPRTSCARAPRLGTLPADERTSLVRFRNEMGFPAIRTSMFRCRVVPAHDSTLRPSLRILNKRAL